MRIFGGLLAPLLLTLLVLVVGACGNGTLGDIWDSFPEEAFEPGDGDGGGGPPPPSATLTEVAALAGGQGVTGTVRNIALASLSGETYAFLAAGSDGCHVVDVTEPDLVNSSSYITTIREAVLSTVDIDGGTVDDVAVVDNAFLVCLSVAPAAPNGVTVFHIPTLLGAATSRTADLSAAYVAPAPGAAIPVTGDSAGKGGGVSGSSGNFFVATGAAVAHAGVAAAGWTVISPALALGTPAMSSVTDVIANQTTAVYASGRRSDGKFGVVAIAHPALPIPATPAFLEVPGEIQRVIDDFVSGPGSYPLNLAIDTLSLYATGNNEVFVYNITNPVLPALVTTVTGTGTKTIAATAGGGVFALGAGDAVRAGANVLGQARITGSLTFPGTYTARGVAVRSTEDGTFALVCAGTGGMRVVEIPRGGTP